jgi:hypothetical protein
VAMPHHIAQVGPTLDRYARSNPALDRWEAPGDRLPFMTAHEENEIGIAPPRGRPQLSRRRAERMLSSLARKEIRLGPKVVAHRAPETCPACGSTNVMWGCDEGQQRSQDEIHPFVWHKDAWMADSFICRDCDAGWIEPDDSEPITWVRPYWRT